MSNIKDSILEQQPGAAYQGLVLVMRTPVGEEGQCRRGRGVLSTLLLLLVNYIINLFENKFDEMEQKNCLKNVHIVLSFLDIYSNPS